MDVGSRLRFFREQKGYTVNKLANLAGLSQSAVREIELFGRQPTVESLEYLCGALEISLRDFFDDGVKKSILEDELIGAVYSLNQKQRDCLLALIRSLKKEG